MTDRTVILFDIDGTLVSRIHRDASRKQQAFTQAVESIYGVSGVNYMNHNIFGLTDRGILDLVLQENGVDRPRIELKEQAFINELCRLYARNLEVAPQEYQALPGIDDLLPALRKQPLGVATGNFEMIARHKMNDAELVPYFPFGGYGEDAIERSDIVRAALDRADVARPCSGFLFGDTPHDITAGQANGLRVGAVTTGRFSREELQAYCGDDDRVFDDLSDTAAVLAFLEISR